MFKNTLKKLLATSILCFSTFLASAVEVNQADAPALQSIKGIGSSTAQNILQARDQGEFTSWEDLISRVKGIGKVNAAKFSAGGLRVNDEAYGQDTAPTPPPSEPDQ